MNFKKSIIVAALAMGVTGMAQATDQGHGTVTFIGSIIDAPCSITPESAEQTVDLGQISNIALKDGGKSVPQDFTIELQQCDTETAKSVVTTFSGAASASNPDMLGISGTASGASVAITDAGGNLIKLGEDSTAQTLNDGTNNLRFAAYLQGDAAVEGENGSESNIVPGDFTAVADFKLTYQ
ncbi:type 1 fimbrial protein [Salmonella enterica]|nr:type 1 fimbrial protein [Salmonella enterica]